MQICIIQLKSEFLKLKYSRLFIAVPILFLAGLIFIRKFQHVRRGTQLFVSEGDEETNAAIQGTIGFLHLHLKNIDTPKFSEIMQSCISCNVFLWIVTLILTIQFFCYDYSAGTIKLPVAYGIDRVKVYFAKTIVIVLYNAVCYFIFNTITLLFTCLQTGYLPDTTELVQYLSYVGLNFLVMVSFILLCLTICICLKILVSLQLSCVYLLWAVQ